MTANTDKLLSILTGILITVLVYFLAFWFRLALAKFILVPMFGTAICSTIPHPSPRKCCPLHMPGPA